MNPKGVVIFTGGSQEPRGPADEAHLWVCSGKNIGRRFALDTSEVLIGRSPEAQIPVLDERVSQKHARIVRKEGRHYIVDLRSTNGTFVNNRKIDEAKLRDGDVIQVGETAFEYLSYEKRNLTINVSAKTSPDAQVPEAPSMGDTASGARQSSTKDEAVPAALRAGAQQILQRARHTPPSPSPSPRASTTPVAPMSPLTETSPGHTVDVTANDPARSVGPLHRPAQALGTTGSIPVGAYQVEDRSGVMLDYDDEDEEGGFDIQEAIAKARKVYDFFRPYWKSILAMGVVGSVVAVAMFLAKPPPRKAVFEVSLIAEMQANPLGRYERSSGGFFKAAQQSFRSATLIERTLAELGEEHPAPERLADIQGRLAFGSLAPQAPSTYKGSYSAKTGDEAIKFLETHVRLFLESEIDKTLKVIKAEADFLAGQLAETEKELRRTESELLEFKKENMEGLPEQARNNYDRLFELKRQQSDIQMRVAQIREESKLSETRLRVESPLIKTRVLATQPYQESIVAIERDLLRERAAGKGPEHPDVSRLVANLRELKKKAVESRSDDTEVETSRNPIYDTVQNELRRLEVQDKVARQEAGRIGRELEEARSIVDRLPELEAMHAELTRSYAATQTLHTRLFEQLNTTQLQLELERATAAARYDIITPPNLEYVPVKETMIKRAGLGSVGGIFAGILLAAIRRLRRSPVLVKALARRPEPGSLQ